MTAELADKKKAMARPLEGIRVVEYGVFHAGPGASAILGDLGAEIIKIEKMEGDPERSWTELGGMDISLPDGESIWFQISNRNKKGICLDIENEKGWQVFTRLIEGADIFLTNLRKSTKAGLGINYESVASINPRIIHANVSGYGPKGPMDDLGAFDPLGQGRSGMMFTTGAEEPAAINIGVLDQATSITMSHAVLTALFVRERTGVGQEVHVSLYGTGLWLLYGNLAMTAGLSADPSNISAKRSENSPLRNRYCCKDNKWIVSSHHPEGKYWSALCEATGQTALLKDPRFSDDKGLRDNRSELVEIFDSVFSEKTRDKWIEILTANGLMFSPIYRIHEILTDPQALANEYVVDFEHPAFGKIRIPGYPVHFSTALAGTHSAAPTLGEHTQQVMRDIGYEDEEIQKLKNEGIIC